MSLWFQKGTGPDGEPWLFEVDEGTAEHKQLVSSGATLVEAPDAPKKAARGKKAADDEGDTLGD